MRGEGADVFSRNKNESTNRTGEGGGMLFNISVIYIYLFFVTPDLSFYVFTTINRREGENKGEYNKMGREKVYSYARVPVGIIPVYYMYACNNDCFNNGWMRWVVGCVCCGWLCYFGCVIACLRSREFVQSVDTHTHN